MTKCYFFQLNLAWLLYNTTLIVYSIRRVKVAAWLSGSCSTHARLVLGWVTAFAVSGIPSWYLPKPPRPTQPGHPSVDRHNEYWRWSRSPLGKKRRVLCNSGPLPGLLAYWHSKGAGRYGAGYPADV